VSTDPRHDGHRDQHDDGMEPGPSGATTSDQPTSPGPLPDAPPVQQSPEYPAGEAVAPDADATAEDDALREERARRFGTFGRSREAETGSAEGAVGGEAGTTAPPPPEPSTTQPVPAGEPTAQYPADSAQPPPDYPADQAFEDRDDVPSSRAPAHWWVVLINLVFTPAAWYLIVDGGERWSNYREVAPEAIHVPALAEILGGLALLAIVFTAARWSSVGPIVVGAIAVIIGGAFLVIPQTVEGFLLEYS